MPIILNPIYHENREIHADDYEVEDYSPHGSINYFESGSSIMSVTTTRPGLVNYIVLDFKLDNSSSYKQ